MSRPPLPDATDPARRRLLGRARNAGIAAAAASVLAPVPAATPVPAAQPAPETKNEQRGYRDSERNRRYYALARY